MVVTSTNVQGAVASGVTQGEVVALETPPKSENGPSLGKNGD